MDIRIIEAVLNVFVKQGIKLRFNQDDFEIALNDEAPSLVEERYLMVLGMRIGVMDMLIFDENYNKREYVSYLMENQGLKEEEALFMLSCFSSIIKKLGFSLEIPLIHHYIDEAYQKNDYRMLMVLAEAYFKGFGVLQDYEKAFEMYSYLYEQGVLESAYYLGYMYEYGLGIEKDIEKAFEYYRLSEDDQSYYHLGDIYMSGQYGVYDEEKGLSYLEASHFDKAYLKKAHYYEEKRDYGRAFEAYYDGALLFEKECLYQAGMYFKRGIGTSVDLNEAKKCFEYGYYLCDGRSTYELSMMYFDGIIVDKNLNKALDYLYQAATLQSTEACLLLSRFYEQGLYVKKDFQQATKYRLMYHDLYKEESNESIQEN